jgi:signal transduction histidine kinase
MEPPNTILLVDDEKDIRDVLQIALMDIGYNILTAENGQAALALFHENHPPIVMTDIKMPVMDGIELLKQLKREDPETEVVMITGHGDMDLAIRSLKHEATDFITKPINVDALDIALRRVREKIIMRRKLSEYTANLESLVLEKSELQDHLASLGLMIGAISHGIKGLLTGLDGGMYMLESGLTRHEEDKIKEGRETIKLVVDRIRKMVMDILFYAKERELQWEKTDVARFSHELTRMVAAKIEDLPIDLEYHIADSVGACQIDPGYVHAALMNIFDNAIDACLRKEGEAETERRIIFNVQPDDGHIVFSVRDTGIGMDDDTLTQIFTAFYSSKGRRGTGLGLFITHKIISQHGGTISVHSSPGRGSRFTIKLPKQACPETAVGA